MSHACVMPAGEVITAPAELELMPTQPTSIVFGVDVVTPGRVADVPDAAAAVVGAPSRGCVGSTPL